MEERLEYSCMPHPRPHPGLFRWWARDEKSTYPERTDHPLPSILTEVWPAVPLAEFERERR